MSNSDGGSLYPVLQHSADYGLSERFYYTYPSFPDLAYQRIQETYPALSTPRPSVSPSYEFTGAIRPAPYPSLQLADGDLANPIRCRVASFDRSHRAGRRGHHRPRSLPRSQSMFNMNAENPAAGLHPSIGSNSPIRSRLPVDTVDQLALGDRPVHYQRFLLEPIDGRAISLPDSRPPPDDAPALSGPPSSLTLALDSYVLETSVSGQESDTAQNLSVALDATPDDSQDEQTPTSVPTPQAESPTSTEHARSMSSAPEIETASSPDQSTKDDPCRSSRRARLSARKPKMHQCQTCQKWFPRPSGLATHMNTHSGAKPYTCPVPGCCRRFGVRSNAKRHLRTHGIIATADMSFLSSAEDTDSETAPEHEGWVPQSLRKRCLKLEDPDSCPILIPELSPVRPISYSREGVMLYEERDSFAKAPIAPYHPDCWARLPGPAPKPAPTYIYQTPSCLWEVAGGSFT